MRKVKKRKGGGGGEADPENEYGEDMRKGGKTPDAGFVRSKSRQVVESQLDKKLRDQGFTSGRNDPRAPKFSLFQDKKTGEFVFREKQTGKKGMKFNPKYTRGSANVGKRKKLMNEISNIYKKHRGTSAKRKKKGFPPAVAARLKTLMKQRDKI